MDATTLEIGQRIRGLTPAGMSQAVLAKKVAMTPDALSRALNGHRGFSPLELVRFAELFGVDMHWLATGRRDPHRLQVAARHDWDHDTQKRVNPGRASDEGLVNRVVEAYRAAYPKNHTSAGSEGIGASARIATNAAGVATALGEDFVRPFADRIEAVFGVDVVRIPGLSAAYSLTIGERGVIILPTEAYWYRSNWSLAHELGHLALKHHDADQSEDTYQENERQADLFAADLLLPRSLMRGLDWSAADEPDVAQFVWEHGVSTAALKRRLAYLRIDQSPAVVAAVGMSTPSLVRRYFSAQEKAERERDAASRRFPVRLIAELGERVEDGRAGPAALAWVLDVAVEEVVVDESAVEARLDRLTRPDFGDGEELDWPTAVVS
ncbi:helix-turn-helix domain-containing protein [Gordonia iterans]